MNNKLQGPVNEAKDPRHLSFLLRLWRTDPTGTFNWRASLEMLDTGRRIGFANLEQLFAYLMDLIEGRAGKQDPTAAKEGHEMSGSNRGS